MSLFNGNWFFFRLYFNYQSWHLSFKSVSAENGLINGMNSSRLSDSFILSRVSVIVFPICKYFEAGPCNQCYHTTFPSWSRSPLSDAFHLHLLAHLCLTTFWRSSIFAAVSQRHLFTSTWSLDSIPRPRLTILLWGDSLSNSTLSCLYCCTSLATSHDKKKVHISLLIIPRLNFTSLHSRPATPTIPASTPQTSTQSTST